MAIGVGARIVPAIEDGADRGPQLLAGILRERLLQLALDRRLVVGDDLRPLVDAEIGVRIEAVEVLEAVEDVFEYGVVEPHHHVAEHLDEAAVAVVGKTGVAGMGGKPFDRDVVQPEIQDRIHHARHGGARARAHRDQQRVIRIAEAGAGGVADFAQRLLDLGLEAGRKAAMVGIISSAHFGRDREPRRHRQAELHHLGQVGAFASQQRRKFAATLGAVRRKDVHHLRRLGLGCCHTS